MAMSKSTVKKIGLFPGSFKPMHIGHFLSVLAAKESVDKLYLFLSEQDRVRPGEFPLSGKVAKEYVQKFIQPVLESKGVEVVFVPGSPVGTTFQFIKDNMDKPVDFYLFAGPEDIEGRYSLDKLQKLYPTLAAEDRIHPVALKEVQLPSGKRISGTMVRQALTNGDAKLFASLLPDIPELKKAASTIMQSFVAASKELTAKAEKPKAPKVKKLAEVVSRVLFEEVGRLVVEGKFPAKWEKVILALKDEYGDPADAKTPEERQRLGALVYGTVHRLMKQGKKKAKK